MIVSAIFAAALIGQTPPAAVQGAPLDVQLPAVEGLSADPTCGGREAMVAIATCFATTQAGIENVVDVWNAAFAQQGWLAADGQDNRILYIRRKDGGGCDAFQILAFADNMQSMAPAAPAYLALAAIPSDICSAAIVQPQGPVQGPPAPTAPQ